MPGRNALYTTVSFFSRQQDAAFSRNRLSFSAEFVLLKTRTATWFEVAFAVRTKVERPPIFDG